MLIQGTHNLGSCSWRGLERSWLQESRTSWVHYRIIPWRQIVLLPVSFIIECKWPFRIGLKCVCWFAQPQTELLDDPVTPLLSTYPKEVTASAWRGICASVQREALSAIAKRLKQPNCSSVGERIKKKKVCRVPTVDYYTACKKKAMLMHAATWKSSERKRYAK